MAAVAAALGQTFMPHQMRIAEVAGEMIQDDETGLWVPAYPEVVVTIPRQNGKTTWVLASEVDRLYNWERLPQTVAYTAQTGLDGRKKFGEDQIPLLKASPFDRGVKRYYTAAENTGMVLKNGGRLRVWATTPHSGHGQTIDMGVLDEIFADEDNRREQAMTPAQATRADAQILITSTAGDDRSQLLERKQAAGRHAVDSGATEGIAYFEWSADEDSDYENPETWRGCMPALGHTITTRTVAAALDKMAPRINGKRDPELVAEFKRAWLNIPKKSGGARVIPEQAWKAAQAPDLQLQGPVTFAADAHPDRTSGSIAVADRHGRVELVEHREHTGWMDSRLRELLETWNAEVAIDNYGPAGELIRPLRESGYSVVEYGTREYVHACSRFFDDINDGNVWVRAHGQLWDVLDAAARDARKRPVGDDWVWARRHPQTDISPIVAVTIAVVAAAEGETDPQVMLI